MPARRSFWGVEPSGDTHSKRSASTKQSFWGVDKSGKGSSTPETLPQLERAVADTGSSTFLDTAKSAGMGLIDLISRPNYAVAGASQELFTDKGGGPVAALERAGTELFSGIGGLKGQKKGFGQVMEEAGVGTGGSLSDLAPFIYSDTGEGLPLKKGGILDPTLRGAGGLALDIATDPLTYVTGGGRQGAKIFGATIPGSAKVASAVADAAKSTVKSVPMFDKAVDVLGATFNRDWKIRNLPNAVRLKQAHLNRMMLKEAQLYDELGHSAIAAIPKSERSAFVDALDDGTWAEKFKDKPKLLQAAQEATQINARWAEKEVADGLLSAESVRPNYIGHFYENSPEELSKVKFLRFGTTLGDKATLGRHAELRAFDTLKEAEEWSKGAHALDPSVPILRPVRDPLEIMRRRGEAHIRATEFQQYYGEIASRFGKAGEAFDPQAFFDLTQEIPTSAGEAEKIGAWVKAGKTPVEEFNKLSSNARKEFMRQRLLKAESPAEATAILRKYGEFNAPKQVRLIGSLAEDGTPYVSTNIERLKDIEIPKSIADDLADMSERVFRSQELDHLLRWYDRVNNTFKGFVTVMFPAFHARNAYSNIAQGFADVGLEILNPARHFDSYASMRGLDGALVTKTGESIPYKQIQKEMAEHNVTTTGRKMLEYTGAMPVERLSTVGGKVKAAPRRIGQAIENEARAALYTVYRRRGQDAVTAAENVNKFLFDYTNLSRVEQDFFRRAIPFYTWTRKNMERQFRNVLTKPGLTAAEIKPFRGREDENQMLTSWDAAGLKLRLNRDGKTLRVLTGIDLPVKQTDLLWRGSLKGTAAGVLGMLSPVLKTPVEIATGKSLFTGNEFSRSNSPAVGKLIDALDPPQGVKDWIGYKKETDAAGRPKYTFDGQRFYILFQSYALSRFISTSDRQFREYLAPGQEGVAATLLDSLTGLRYKELNLDEEQAKKIKEREAQLRQALIRSGQIREGSYYWKPKQ